MKYLWLSVLCALLLRATVSAHVLDEYVQASQLKLAPNGVGIELRLTPGVAVADRVFAMIDRDHDGKTSKAEEEAYAQRVVKDVAFELDGQQTPLTLTSFQFPSKNEMKDGVGVIQLDLWANASLRAGGDHQVSFRNNHVPQFSTYLANVLVPASEAVRITGQERDALQHRIQVNVSVTSVEPPVSLITAPVAESRWPLVLMSIVGLSLLSVIWLAIKFSLRKQIPS
jgi:hypothetical protein